jgi:D-alanyl-lipoteichoic acid acyltransferase DltB (MBOAT superfamily)
LQFNSYIFAAFFIVVLAVYNLPVLTWRGQKVWLLLASYAFYAAWDPVFIVLVWLSTLIDWGAAKLIIRSATQHKKRALLIVSVVVNLGVLGYFKYGNFIRANVVAILHAVGVEYHPAPFDIVLPIGISFYTFHTLSYTLDVYLGRTKPWDSFLDFALYVTFFPALVAGPILRGSQFLPQCVERRRTTGRQLAWGLALMTLGLFEKTCLADTIFAPTADDVFAVTGHLATLDGWTGTLAFAGQIACDFAGYSTCAIGAALCFGFSLPDNFRFPYSAVGFSDFWERWHISLSTWLRDYLYIPLGGNRLGPARTYINLMLTMLIGGLWHGASWTFVVWGGLHGTYLIGERVIRRVVPWTGPIARTVGVIVTFVLVCIAWVFFRASSFDQAFSVLRSMFGIEHAGALFRGPTYGVIGVTMLAVLAVHWVMHARKLEDVVERTPWPVRSFALAAMLVTIILMQGQDRAFIYFQF